MTTNVTMIMVIVNNERLSFIINNKNDFLKSKVQEQTREQTVVNKITCSITFVIFSNRIEISSPSNSKDVNTKYFRKKQ